MGDADDIKKLVTSATKKWKSQRMAEEKSQGSFRYRASRMTKSRSMSQKDAAAQVMHEAYMKASGNGKYPATARQIMYAARGKIQELTDGKPLRDHYFTQVLLPDYIRDNNLNWNVVYDDRGHFAEPHSDISFGLGTLNVRNYLRSIKAPDFIDAHFEDTQIQMIGPKSNFGAVLYIEKEGFTPLLEAANLAQRLDIATISAKGVSVTAARRLVEDLCAHYDIPLFILHDFDRAGMVIAHTLHNDTRRYEFTKHFEVVDIGLRLEDVQEMDLDEEDAGGSNISDEYLQQAGATPEEIAFLQDSRVELNAMTSDQMIELIETKLEEHGIGKIIPGDDLLKETYEKYVISKALIDELKNHQATIKNKPVGIPKNLKKRIDAILDKKPELPWHQAVRAVIDPTILEPPKTTVTRDGRLPGLHIYRGNKRIMMLSDNAVDTLPDGEVKEAIKKFLKSERKKPTK